MQWTSEPPTEPGWYFFQRINPPNFYPIRIFYCDFKFYPLVNEMRMTLLECRKVNGLRPRKSMVGTPISDMTEHYRWAGPIPEPEE